MSHRRRLVLGSLVATLTACAGVIEEEPKRFWMSYKRDLAQYNGDQRRCQRSVAADHSEGFVDQRLTQLEP